MKEKPPNILKKEKVSLYERIRQILESARTNIARTVNTTQIVANWLIGREIVEEEQEGRKRAGYGEQILEDLSAKLTRDFGTGYSEQNLRFIRQLYLTYPLLLGDPKIRYAVRSESIGNIGSTRGGISHAVRTKSERIEKIHALRGKSDPAYVSDAAPRKLTIPTFSPVLEIGHALRSESWQPGQLHPNLSWTHYRTLLRVDKVEARAFYEIEAIQNNWSARELERQINSLLYERLALSKDKKGLMRLAIGSICGLPKELN